MVGVFDYLLLMFVQLQKWACPCCIEKIIAEKLLASILANKKVGSPAQIC